MKLIGLTGGIGAGKSTVADIFTSLSIPVYNSDLRAKVLMNTNDDIRKKITDLFGSDSYSDTQELNTSLVASKVFNDRDLLLRLNAIIHPAVYEDLLEWSSQPAQVSAPYLIQESAILFEENLIDRLKAVILVVAPEEIRISRVMNRDDISKDKVMDRIQNQWPDEKKIPLSDFVIFNDGVRSMTEQVRDIDHMIKDRLN